MLFFERGQTWSSVLKSVLSHCIGKDTKVLKCESWDKILKEGMDGGQVRCLSAPPCLLRSAITTIDPETIDVAMIEFAALTVFDALLMLMLGAMFC